MSGMSNEGMMKDGNGEVKGQESLPLIAESLEKKEEGGNQRLV